MARQHAQENAHVQAELDSVQQESERQNRWLAEESALLTANQDLRNEKAKELLSQRPQLQARTSKKDTIDNGI